MIKLAVDNIQNWIFVTGVPRSGTTFVGMTLSLPKEVDYIHEPFNPMCGVPGIDRWYCYLGSNLDNEEELKQYERITESIFDYNFVLRNNVPATDGYWRRAFKHTFGSRGPFYSRLAKINLFHQAAIIKDPIGSLLTKYLYDNFHVKPVIIIKHPVSFIASLKRVNFWPNLTKLNNRKQLVNDYFADETEFLYHSWSNNVLAAAAFWRTIYKVLLTQAAQHSDWQVITHEKLSQEPMSTFEYLYETLELPWSKNVARKIMKQTQGSKRIDVKQGVVQDFQRDSAKIFQMRRDSISLEERKAIFEVVKDVALKVYTKESFAID